MNTNTMSREQISALADSELADSQVDVVLALLRQRKEQAAWDIYHQIGDVLRSEDMAIAMRPDFAARMAARLDAEPVIITPAFSEPLSVSAPVKAGANGKINFGYRFKRFAIPGALAAAASVALITAPQLMVAMKSGSAEESIAQMMVASPNRPVSHAGMMTASVPQSAVASSVSSHNVKILRDPHIDEYLRAHQRFSPSVYNSAQFARSATLAHDSEK